MKSTYQTLEERYLDLWNFVDKFAQIGLYPTSEEFWKLVEEARNIV